MKTRSKPPATLNEIEKHYNKARQLAVNLLEHRARVVMRAHPNCTEFVCAMGSATFTVKRPGAVGGEIVIDPCSNLYGTPPAYMIPVAEVIDNWDCCLKLTGEGFRFTADGPICRNW